MEPVEESTDAPTQSKKRIKTQEEVGESLVAHQDVRLDCKDIHHLPLAHRLVQ